MQRVEPLLAERHHVRDSHCSERFLGVCLPYSRLARRARIRGIGGSWQSWWGLGPKAGDVTRVLVFHSRQGHTAATSGWGHARFPFS